MLQQRHADAAVPADTQRGAARGATAAGSRTNFWREMLSQLGMQAAVDGRATLSVGPAVGCHICSRAPDSEQLVSPIFCSRSGWTVDLGTGFFYLNRHW